MWLPALISVSAALLVFLLITLIFNNSSERQVKRRISVLMTDPDLDKIHEEVMKEKQKRDGMTRKGSTIGQKLEDELAMSGIKLNAREYLSAWAGLTLIPVLLMALLGRNIISIVGVGIIGLVIPPLLVGRAKKKRQQLFNKQLSDSLVVMSNCMKSGYTFQQALESISSDMQPPISIEFARVLREIRYGVKQEDALIHMVKRVQNKDLAMLVSAVIVSSQVGANLSDILDNIAETIKDRIKIRDDVRILSAQGRISGLIIGLLPIIITLILMVINPTYILSFFNTQLGKMMICVGLIFEVIGFTIINRIVDIKY